MSDSPFRIVPLEKKVGDLLRRVGVLERKAKAGGATTLDALRDTEVLYDHWTDLPKQDQALRWDTTRDSKFHGLATFRDPEVVDDYFTASVTGAGTFGVSEFLVDTDWDLTRPCLATATVIFDGGYTDVAVTPPTTPATYIPRPMLIAGLNDRGTGYVATPGGTYEAASHRIDLGANSELTLAWIYLRGRPKVNVNLTLSSDQYGGVTGTKNLLVITRCVRL